MNPRTVGAAILGAALAGSAAAANPLPSTTATTTYHRTQVDGVGIFYREAGPRDAPTIVLLQGFPSSSRGYAMLIPMLATRYHVVAPDFPGFGQSDAPSPADYSYTFDHLAVTVGALLEQLRVSRYTLYLFDYGAPVGYRIILAHPERLQALIVQNGNAYQEGLGPKWAQIAKFWADPKAHPEVVDAFMSYEATKQRHLAGTSHPDAYDPDSWNDEFAHLSRPGQREIQAALLYDYRTNVASYPAWQAWLREHKPPTLVAWGANDPSFIAAGATRLSRRPAGLRRSTCWTPATSRWRRRTTRSPASSSTSWPGRRAPRRDGRPACRHDPVGAGRPRGAPRTEGRPERLPQEHGSWPRRGRASRPGRRRAGRPHRPRRARQGRLSLSRLPTTPGGAMRCPSMRRCSGPAASART